MNTGPLLSIVTVCYNSDKTIRRTFDSILAQKVKEFQYIIIDGKSTDDTINIINSYIPIFQQHGINTKFISESDTGIYDAMNKGIKLSNGKWVVFLNSDDWYLNNSIDTIINNLDDKYDILAGGINAIKKVNDKYYYKPITPSILHLTKTMSLLHPATTVKKEILEKFYFDTKFKIAGDWDLLKKLLISNYKFLLINDILVNYMEDGISGHESLRLRIEQYKIVNTTRPIFAKYDLVKNIIKLIRKKIKQLFGINKPIHKILKHYTEFHDV
jgi:glycosyltransferase involved in cell wall biosynthesis